MVTRYKVLGDKKFQNFDELAEVIGKVPDVKLAVAKLTNKVTDRS